MSAPKLCPTCGAEYPADERFCPRDGTALRAQDGGADLVGTIVAERYHVLSKLGEGGMGQVYLAEHVKMGRRSAVKVMNPGMAQDGEAISRFNREAANASRINHPNVAGVYDFGETADGLIFLAMELVEGEPLTRIVERQGALSPARAAEIVRQTGEALAAAHEMSIVHRDLKPDNIMIARGRDGADCVKVVDFGIAKAATNEAKQKVTRTGLIVGTPEYMSPEQLAGDPLDGRSDIYSLGLVAFNALTGQLPFPSETAQESMIMRLTEQPKRLRDARPDVAWPAEVQAVMDRALARDAARRYASASEFGQALKGAVERMSLEPAAAAAGASAPTPPTRVDAAAARRPEPSRTAPGGLRGRQLVAGGVALAAAAIGLWAASRDPAPGAAAAATPRATPAVAVASDSAPPMTGPLVSQTGLPADPALTPPAPRGKIVDSVPAAIPGVAPGVAPSVAPRIRLLLEQARDDATAAAAMQEARTLMSRATPVQIVGLRLVQATGLALQNDSARACPILRDIRDRATSTEYESDVKLLLQHC